MKGPSNSTERKQAMKRRKEQAERQPLGDSEIIELFFARDERAIEETDLKYGKYLLSVAYNIVHDNLDCEECLNDTYLGAWNAIPPARPDVLRSFLLTIMRRTAIKRYHKNRRKSVIPSEMTLSLSELEDFVEADGGVDSEFNAAELSRIINSLVCSLPERRQFIFMSRYYVADPIDTIANDLGVSRSTVNKELASIREALKKKLESEGYII
jgi:RNA polymerase sigma-70 factor (ECF subfamily)